ncbi:MAG: flagellar motor protein MotB [Pseudomonadota bacterium]
MSQPNSVIIIKRKKTVVEEGHHGGAWKVAYADFVTAMMAFFLLMWLLNATTEEQRKGLADYFDPRIPISRISGGGTGAFGGDTSSSQNEDSQSGLGASDSTPMDNERPRGESGVNEDGGAKDGTAESLTALDNMFRGVSGESDRADPLLQHIRTRQSDEGLVIELFDVAGKPLFERGSDQPTDLMVRLMRMVADVTTLVTNELAVKGHTDGRPFTRGGYGNWELSADRAHAVRRGLVTGGIAPDRMQRVTGRADRELAHPELPLDPRNRRVEITLLRSDI